MGLFLTALGVVRSAIWRILSRLSLWQAVSLALACLSLWLYVHGNREAARAAKAEEQVASLQRSIKRANDEAAKRTQAANQITDQLRREKDEADRRIADDARTLKLRGPGAGRCLPAVSQGSGGHQGSSPAAGAPVDPVPDGESFLAVPFPEAVRLAQNHDTLRSEVLAWRSWWAQQSANTGPRP